MKKVYVIKALNQYLVRFKSCNFKTKHIYLSLVAKIQLLMQLTHILFQQKTLKCSQESIITETTSLIFEGRSVFSPKYCQTAMHIQVLSQSVLSGESCFSLGKLWKQSSSMWSGSLCCQTMATTIKKLMSVQSDYQEDYSSHF